MSIRDYSEGLNFAIMIDSYDVDQWQYDSIESLMREPGVKLVAIVLNNPETRKYNRRVLSKSWHNLLFKFYQRSLFKPKVIRKKNIEEFAVNVPVIICSTELKGEYEYFHKSDIDAIQNCSPDFIIRFGFNNIRGEILTSTPLGIWAFHHGDEQKFRGFPHAFWEIYTNDHKTGAILHRLTEDTDSGIILRKGHFKTIDHSWSLNYAQVVELTKRWPADVCREIINQNTFPDLTKGVETNAQIYSLPGNTTFFLFLLKLLNNKIRHHFNELFSSEIWQTGVIKARTADIIGELTYTIDPIEVDWYTAKGKDNYFADSFAIRLSERLLLLYEDYSYRARLGKISAVWFNERDFTFSEPVTLLEEPWHLSYPFIFKHNNIIYCIPSCNDKGSIDLYRLDVQTLKLVHERALVKGVSAIDSTLIFHQNHWFLFFTSSKAANVELHIWHSDDLDKEFIPHVLNPVKSDISNSRPAGPLFYLDGRLYRPSQDCSHSYGGRVIIHEVKVLSEDSFLEMVVSVLEPPEGFKGLHTISFAGDFMYFDAKKSAFSPASFRYHLKRKLGLTK